MSLWASLRIGTREIGYLEIIRISNTSQGALTADAVSEYLVWADKQEIGKITHRYGDGAWALLKKAVAVIPDEGPSQVERQKLRRSEYRKLERAHGAQMAAIMHLTGMSAEKIQELGGLEDR